MYYIAANWGDRLKESVGDGVQNYANNDNKICKVTFVVVEVIKSDFWAYSGPKEITQMWPTQWKGDGTRQHAVRDVVMYLSLWSTSICSGVCELKRLKTTRLRNTPNTLCTSLQPSKTSTDPHAPVCAHARTGQVQGKETQHQNGGQGESAKCDFILLCNTNPVTNHWVQKTVAESWISDPTLSYF